MRVLLTLSGETAIAETCEQAAASFIAQAERWRELKGAYPELRVEWDGGAKCWAPDQVAELLNALAPSILQHVTDAIARA